MTSLPHLTENVAQRAAVLRVVNEVMQAAGGDAIQSSVAQAGLPRVVLNALAVLAPLDARGDTQSSQEKFQIVALFHASVLHALQRKGMDVSVLAFEGMVASATDSICQDILSSGQYTLFQDLWQDCSSSEGAAQGGVVLGALIGGPLAVAGVAWSAAPPCEVHYSAFIVDNCLGMSGTYSASMLANLGTSCCPSSPRSPSTGFSSPPIPSTSAIRMQAALRTQ